jgi:ferredoxin
MTKIFYFSGTGNSLWSAKKIAHNISGADPGEKCGLYNIGVEARRSEKIITADAVIFVFPSFAYGMPHVVRKFIKSAVFKTPYFAAFVTFGSSPGGTLGSVRRIIKKKEINKMFFGRIPAVENYLAIFGTPKDGIIKQRCQMQEKATDAAARSVIEREENKVSEFYPFSFFVYCLFTLGIKIFYNFFRVSGKCTGCASCEKICPVSAIVMKDGKPRFSPKCGHCQGCVNLCPSRAIQFARVRFGTKGYIHPEIDIKEMYRREQV